MGLLLLLSRTKVGQALGQKTLESIDAILSKLTVSNVAERLGIDNVPDNQSELDNLLWLGSIEPQLTALVREYQPGASLNSGYRNDAVNAAVSGSKTSRHLEGLAIDYGVNDPVAVLKWLALPEQRNRLPARARDILAERTPVHLHIDFYRATEVDTGPRFRIERNDIADSFTTYA
jgi:hypothetical protein